MNSTKKQGPAVLPKAKLWDQSSIPPQPDFTNPLFKSNTKPKFKINKRIIRSLDGYDDIQKELNNQIDIMYTNTAYFQFQNLMRANLGGQSSITKNHIKQFKYPKPVIAETCFGTVLFQPKLLRTQRLGHIQ